MSLTFKQLLITGLVTVFTLFAAVSSGNVFAQDEEASATPEQIPFDQVTIPEPIPVSYQSESGESFVAEFFGEDSVQPIILLLSQSYPDGTAWANLALPLLNSGFNILLLDIGDGDSTGLSDEIAGWFQWAEDQGATIDAALAECGDDDLCRSVMGVPTDQVVAEVIPTATPAPTETPLATATPSATPSPIVNELGEIITPTAIPPEVLEQCTHTIRTGDTLFDLAILYETTIEAFNETNDLAVDTILNIGDTLIVPECIETFGEVPQAGTPDATEDLETATPTLTSTPFDGVVHVVESGDILASIAAEYGVTIEDIVAANNLSDPDALSIGQQLNIPGAVVSDVEELEETPVPTDDES